MAFSHLEKIKEKTVCDGCIIKKRRAQFGERDTRINFSDFYGFLFPKGSPRLFRNYSEIEVEFKLTQKEIFESKE